VLHNRGYATQHPRPGDLGRQFVRSDAEELAAVGLDVASGVGEPEQSHRPGGRIGDEELVHRVRSVEVELGERLVVG
jgi:hypothetical protein